MIVQVLGKRKVKHISRSKLEKDNLIYRRSIYFVKDLKKGAIITKDDIKRIRPGYGLKPKYFDSLIGRVVTKNVEREIH